MTQSPSSKTQVDVSKRRLFQTAATLPVWSTPVIAAVVLPAHAQTSTSMCITETTVGGPLAGHPSGAATCQAACESEATNLNAQLCDVRETPTGAGVDCSCDLDLP
jgi:hypothetical protein